MEAEKPKVPVTGEEEHREKKTKVKTVILPDGTYGTMVVDDTGKVDD